MSTCGVGTCGVDGAGFACMAGVCVGTVYVLGYENENEYEKELSS